MVFIMERILRFGPVHVLFDPDRIEAPAPEWFDSDWWQAHDAVTARMGGRGEALAVESPAGPAVLRRYRRGGLIRHVSRDRYVFTGLPFSRPFREWRVTRALFDAGLPVPEPLAAAVQRHGPLYSGALLTTTIGNAKPLHTAGELDAAGWEALGRTIARFATAGLKHPDLNATNILLDDQDRFWLLDFDRTRIAPGPVDPGPMLARLTRSLKKLGIAHDARALHTAARKAEKPS